MTTGTIGSPLISGFTSGAGFSPCFYKDWTGADGRIESYAGGTRTKWNNFTSIINSRVMYQRGFWGWANNGTDPPTPGDPLVYSEYIPSWSQYSDAQTFNSNEQNKLLSKVTQKVKGHQFNLAVELGQMRETVSTLSTNLSKLGRSILALKHGDFATAARQLGASPRSTRLKSSDISGRWLELQYGWLPLLSSSFEAAKAFEAISNGPRSALIRASISKPKEFDHSASPTHYSAKCRGKVTRYLQYEMYEEMSVERQMGLLNPLSVVWELTPYSFVVDWFVPIGTYLDNLNQIPKLLGRWLITDVWKNDGNVQVLWKGPMPNYYSGKYFFSMSGRPAIVERYTRLQRTFSSSPPIVPVPSFNFGGINSSRRFWNAVSLAYQRFAG